MTDAIKRLLKEKESFYIRYVKKEYEESNKIDLRNKQKECSLAIASAKETYLTNEGNKLNNTLIGPKKYWSLLNRFLNKKEND